MDRDDHEEILRIRARQHEMESTLIGLKFLVDDLREWRAQARVQLEDLVKADELAELVADKVKEGRGEELTEGTFRLTRWQARIAAGGFLLALVLAAAGGLKGLVS